MGDGSILAQYPTKVLLRKDGRISCVADPIEGTVLVCLPRLWPIGEVVKGGRLANREDDSTILENRFFVITGHSNWRKARSMANRSKSRDASLERGTWHEVICE